MHKIGHRQKVFLESIDRYVAAHDSLGLKEELETSALFSDNESAIDSMLDYAISESKRELAEMLLGLGVDADVRRDGSRRLLWAIQNCRGDETMVRWLLCHGADSNARGINDWTALHFAAALGYVGVARVLVEHGADVNARTRIDERPSPLDEAASHGHSAMVSFLLENGADPAHCEEPLLRGTAQHNETRDLRIQRFLMRYRKQLGIPKPKRTKKR
jgi:ankyrin repeat protein